jgi:hypothetical protein
VGKSYAFGREVWDILLQCDIGSFSSRINCDAKLRNLECPVRRVHMLRSLSSDRRAV